eukprot:4922704-Amphidinium_carterae.4
MRHAPPQEQASERPEPQLPKGDELQVARPFQAHATPTGTVVCLHSLLAEIAAVAAAAATAAVAEVCPFPLPTPCSGRGKQCERVQLGIAR